MQSLELRWIIGMSVAGLLIFSVALGQRLRDRHNPDSDRPITAELIGTETYAWEAKYYLKGTARYQVNGRIFTSPIDDLAKASTENAIQKKRAALALPRNLDVYYNPQNPELISHRQTIRSETQWVFPVAILGGALLFTAALMRPINSYTRWIATSAPGWMQTLGYVPLILVFVPPVVGLMFLFTGYF